LTEAENAALIRDMKSHIQDLEQDKKTLREASVDNSVAHLQEELIAIKLREAEANLSLKELRHRVADLHSQWQRHLTVSIPNHKINKNIINFGFSTMSEQGSISVRNGGSRVGKFIEFVISLHLLNEYPLG